jgi:hypothetical protein
MNLLQTDGNGHFTYLVPERKVAVLYFSQAADAHSFNYYRSI